VPCRASPAGLSRLRVRGTSLKRPAAAVREAAVGLRHIFTKPYTPRTNGKAERFIQTLLREWAYAAAYSTSNARARVLPRWLRYYNEKRPHSSLDDVPPTARIRSGPLNNVLRNHS
jgi:transposase InsO family protein